MFITNRLSVKYRLTVDDGPNKYVNYCYRGNDNVFLSFLIHISPHHSLNKRPISSLEGPNGKCFASLKCDECTTTVVYVLCAITLNCVAIYNRVHINNTRPFSSLYQQQSMFFCVNTTALLMKIR